MSLQRVISFMNKSIKLHVYAAVAAGLALSPIAVHAQTSPTGNARGTTTMSDATGIDARGDRNDHHNYGWIGLAGLLGLAGLMGRKNRHDRYDTASSGSRRADLAGTRS
jgi:LPXTG-motif cell wall-anchored protein